MLPNMRSKVAARQWADALREQADRNAAAASSARKINHSTVTRPQGIRVVGDGTIETEAQDGSATRLAGGVLEQRPSPDEPWAPVDLEGGNGSDGLPPATSPTLALRDGINGVWFDMSLVDNADPTEVDLFVSAVSGFTADELTRETRVQNGSRGVLGTLGGMPLVPGQTVYARAWALDTDGYAPAPSAEVSATVRPIGFDDVSEAIRDELAKSEQALTAAQGKNRNTASSTPSPPTEGRVDGDLHFVREVPESGDDPEAPGPDSQMRIVQIQRLADGVWVDEPVDVQVLAGLDAAFVNTMLLSADTILSRLLAAEEITGEHLTAVLALVSTIMAGPFLEISEATYGDDGELVGGIIVRDPDNPTGPPLVRLHPGGCRFRGELTTDLLTVLEEASILTSLTLGNGSVAELSNGVPNPTQGPELDAGPQATAAWPAPPSGWVQRGITWSDDDGGIWYRLLWNASQKRIAIQKVTQAGVASSFVNTDDALAGVDEVSSICRAGASSFIICSRRAFSSGPWWRMSRYNFAGVHALSVDFRAAADVRGTPAVGNDLTTGNIVLAEATLRDGTEGFNLHPIDPSTLLPGGRVRVARAGGSIPSGSVTLRAVEVGAFDFTGGSKIWLAGNSSNIYADFPGWPPGPAATTSIDATERTDLAWQFDTSITNGGAAWKHSGVDSGRFHSTHNDNQRTVWGDYKPNNDRFWTARYADRNGSLTTQASPATTLAVPARRIVTATLPTAPNGVTGAALWVGYGATGPVTTLRLRPETIPANRAVRLTQGKLTTGSTALPGTNTMGGVPAVIRSQVQGGSGWAGHGNGRFAVRTPQADDEAAHKGFVEGKYRSGRFTVPSYTGNATLRVNFSPPFPPGVVPVVVVIHDIGTGTNIARTAYCGNEDNAGFTAVTVRAGGAADPAQPMKYIAIAP